MHLVKIPRNLSKSSLLDTDVLLQDAKARSKRFFSQNLFSQPKRLILHEVLRGKTFSSHTRGPVTLLGKISNTSLKKCLKMSYSAVSKTSSLLASHSPVNAIKP